jgi:hypothetical protein
MKTTAFYNNPWLKDINPAAEEGRLLVEPVPLALERPYAVLILTLERIHLYECLPHNGSKISYQVAN